MYVCLCMLQCGRTALPNTGVENYKSINQGLNHAREQVAFAREHQLTARGKSVNAREYVFASVKLKTSSTVVILCIHTDVAVLAV